jgi:hypothetical protein
MKRLSMHGRFGDVHGRGKLRIDMMNAVHQRLDGIGIAAPGADPDLGRKNFSDGQMHSKLSHRLPSFGVSMRWCSQSLGSTPRKSNCDQPVGPWRIKRTMSFRYRSASMVIGSNRREPVSFTAMPVPASG